MNDCISHPTTDDLNSSTQLLVYVCTYWPYKVMCHVHCYLSCQNIMWCVSTFSHNILIYL